MFSLILSSHLRLGLPIGLFSSGFPHQNPVHTSICKSVLSSLGDSYIFFSLIRVLTYIILTSAPRSPHWSLSLRFPHQNPVHTSRCKSVLSSLGDSCIFFSLICVFTWTNVPYVVIPVFSVFFSPPPFTFRESV